MPSLTVGTQEAGPTATKQNLEEIIASFGRRGLGGQPQLRQALLRAQGPSLRRELSGLQGEIEGERRAQISTQQRRVAGQVDILGDLTRRLAELSARETGLQTQLGAINIEAQTAQQREEQRRSGVTDFLSRFGGRDVLLGRFPTGGFLAGDPTQGGFNVRNIGEEEIGGLLRRGGVLPTLDPSRFRQEGIVGNLSQFGLTPGTDIQTVQSPGAGSVSFGEFGAGGPITPSSLISLLQNLTQQATGISQQLLPIPAARGGLQFEAAGAQQQIGNINDLIRSIQSQANPADISFFQQRTADPTRGAGPFAALQSGIPQGTSFSPTLNFSQSGSIEDILRSLGGR